MGPITPVHPSAFGPGSEVLRFPPTRGPWVVGINTPPFLMLVMPFSRGLTFPRGGSVRHLKVGFNRVGRSRLCQPPPHRRGDHSWLQCDLGRQSPVSQASHLGSDWRLPTGCHAVLYTSCLQSADSCHSPHDQRVTLWYYYYSVQLDCFYLLRI